MSAVQVSDSEEMLDDVIAAKFSFEEFATSDKFIDQGYYDSEDGVVVKDYHMEWVNALEDNQKVAITAFTGSGKTSIPGVLYPLWRIFRDPSTNILIISATLSQATRILNEIKHHIEHAEYLEELKPEDRQASWSKSKVEFTTGGEIKCKPIGNGAKAVKGSHVDLAICDEAAEFDDQEKFHRNVRTRVESQSGDICLISTPVHENDLMANVSDGEMEKTCKLCRRTVKNGNECPEHGELEDREIDGGDDISEMGFWNKSYGVYEEDVSPEDEDSFPLTTSDDTKYVKPLFPENFDRQKIMKLREENMTMFQKEYLCLGAGTKIQLQEGMKNIEDIEVGDKVLTHKGNFKKVTETMERKAEEKVKVKTKGWSDKITMTPEHPVLTEEGWKEAGELQPEDYLVSPRMSGENSISSDLGNIYGFYLAEGSIGASDRQVTFNFGAHETDIIEKCKQSLRAEGYEPKLYGYGSDSVCRVTVNSVDLVNELTALFGRAGGKKVPKKVFDLDEDSIRSIFESYVDGDGYRPDDGRGKISSVSLELAEGAARMATSLGYTVTRDYFREQGEGGCINGRKIEGNGEYHRVRYYKNTQYNKIEEDYVAYRVKSVEFEREESNVYNIEVEDDHTYHTAQFAVHNCEPLAVEGDLFDPNDIIELYDKDESFEQRRQEGCDYYMGADFAISHQGDYSVFTVVEVPADGKPVVRWMERIRGMGIDAQEDRIEDLHSVFNFTDIVLDETNFGSTAKKNLKQAGLPITGQDFKMKARNNLIVGLKSKIESEEFRIARGGERSKRLTDKLYNELLGFGTTETQSGSVSYKSTAKHDDTVMSLAMVMSSVEQKKDVVATLAF